MTARIGTIEASEETLYELSWILRHSTYEKMKDKIREYADTGEATLNQVSNILERMYDDGAITLEECCLLQNYADHFYYRNWKRSLKS